MTAMLPSQPVPAKTRAAPRPWLDSLVLAGLVVGAVALLLGPLPVATRLVAALLLFVVLPGHLLVRLVFRTAADRLERVLLSLAAGYVLAVVLMLALHMLFRPLTTGHLVVGAAALNGLLLAGVTLARPTGTASTSLLPDWALPGWPVLLIVLVAGPLRLFNLGHHEFQGDEAMVILRAMAVLQGAPDALIAHRKPPGEILLAGLFAGGLGTVTEAAGRLPFSLAGLAGVLAIYLLGRSLFGPRAGLIAALLMAVNGFFVAFGRLYQYQSVILLLDTLAILCLFRYRMGEHRRAYAVLGALFLAGSALMALSAVFLLPVAALALGPLLFGPRRVPARELALWLWPLAPLLPMLALTYLLLARAPGALDLSSVAPYLGPRLGDTRPYFNLGAFLLAVNHYTSSPYLLLTLGGGLVLALEAAQASLRDLAERLGLSKSAAVAAVAVDTRHLTSAGLVAAIIVLALTTARRTLGWKLLFIWLAGPLFAHLFLVRIVATHWREIFPGLCLLLGAALAGLYARLPGRVPRAAAALLGGLFLAATAHYVFVAWVQPWPEYQVLYPLYRHPLDWTNLQVRSAGGTFGSARRHGWKAAGVLTASGELPAEYATNERPAQAAWYLKKLQTCAQARQLYIRGARSVPDRQAVERSAPYRDYSLAGRILAGGRPGLALYTREAPPAGPQTYRLEDYSARFDRELSSPWHPVRNLYLPYMGTTRDCPDDTAEEPPSAAG